MPLHARRAQRFNRVLGDVRGGRVLRGNKKTYGREGRQGEDEDAGGQDGGVVSLQIICE